MEIFCHARMPRCEISLLVVAKSRLHSSSTHSVLSEGTYDMGADWVCLFDKRLCDEIISLPSADIPAFVGSHLSALDDTSEFKCGFPHSVPATVRVAQLREQGRKDEELKADLVDHLCVSGHQLTIDYWGCYVEVFASGDPPGSIPDYTLFPHIKQQRYLLLLPEHVDKMLVSLEEHKHEMRTMQARHLAQLRAWKKRCMEDSGWMVAYFYDV